MAQNSWWRALAFHEHEYPKELTSSGISTFSFCPALAFALLNKSWTPKEIFHCSWGCAHVPALTAPRAELLCTEIRDSQRFHLSVSDSGFGRKAESGWWQTPRRGLCSGISVTRNGVKNCEMHFCTMSKEEDNSGSWCCPSVLCLLLSPCDVTCAIKMEFLPVWGSHIHLMPPKGCHFASSSPEHLDLQRSPDVFSHEISQPWWLLKGSASRLQNSLKRWFFFFFFKGSSGKDFWEDDTRGSSLAGGVESQQLLCFLLYYLGELSAQIFPQEPAPLRGGGCWTLMGTETLIHCDTNPSTQGAFAKHAEHQKALNRRVFWLLKACSCITWHFQHR